MEEKERKKIALEAVDLFGEPLQIDMAVEEAAEVIQAVQHYKRGRVDFYKVLDEFADLLVVGYSLQAVAERRRALGFIQEAIDKKFVLLRRRMAVHRVRLERQAEETRLLHLPGRSDTEHVTGGRYA